MLRELHLDKKIDLQSLKQESNIIVCPAADTL